LELRVLGQAGIHTSLDSDAAFTSTAPLAEMASAAAAEPAAFICAGLGAGFVVGREMGVPE